MSLDQQKIRLVLANEMVPNEWYEIKHLVELFSEVYTDFKPEDIEPIPSEPNRPRWHRLVTNCVRMSPGRNDYPSDNSWIELRTRRPNRNFEYSLAPFDPVELSILSSVTEDDGSGHIYGIVNEAFPNWVKIGKTIDFKQRLAAYQTYSPHQDYKELDKVLVQNRHTAEGVAHRKAADVSQGKQQGEWFYISEHEVNKILSEVETDY